MSPRAFVLLLFGILVLVLVLYTVNARSMTSENRAAHAAHRIEGLDVEQWHRRAVRNRRVINSLRQTLRARPSVEEAIRLAATVYRVSESLLERRAWCESRWDPFAVSSTGALGLFQFIGSTWRSTPYARFSPFSAYSSALAAAWMERVGRGGEWACRG